MNKPTLAAIASAALDLAVVTILLGAIFVWGAVATGQLPY